MNREQRVFIIKAVIGIVVFAVLVFIATQATEAMLSKGYNTIVIALPLAVMFFLLGCWLMD